MCTYLYSLSAVAPTFIQDVTPSNVTFPADLTLTCTATARPQPNITWYKDGVELMESRLVSITSMDIGERVLESTLIVFNPFLDGIGSYTCMAENVVDTANSTAEVHILCELLLDNIAENGCTSFTMYLIYILAPAPKPTQLLVC